MGNCSFINIGEKQSNNKFILDLKNYESLNALLKSIRTQYIVFLKDLDNINIEKIKMINIKKSEGDCEILAFSDCLEYLPNKVDINLFKDMFLETLFIDFNAIAFSKEFLIKINLTNDELKEFKKFILKANKFKYKVNLIDEYIFNKRNNIKFDIDDIFKLKILNEKQSYIYIYRILEIISKEIYSWDDKTSENIINILNYKIKHINLVEFDKFLKLILNDKEYDFINIILLMIKNKKCSQLKLFSEGINKKIILEEELKKNKVEQEKLSFALKSDRLKISIYYDRFITYIRKIIACTEYWITKPFLFNKDIWLIGERTDQAEDNSFRFFKYVRENYPNKNIYYLIDKNSIQYENVKSLGNIIDIDSFKHRIYLMHAEKLISAYDFFNFLLPSDKNRFKKYNMKYMNSTRVFLQHGVAMNKANYYNQYINKYDYMLVSTNKEFNMFTKEYGYSKDKIIKIGLPRYDQLLDTSYKNKNKKILFMPTWRNKLVNLSNDEFKKTEYYNSVNSLINDKELNRLLEENNLELVVYLHYEMQIFNKCFEVKGKNVILRSREDSVVQDLLKESNLLITDYSSVGVDFSYLNKPVIFYQFSKHNFHYDINKEIDYTLYSDFGKVINTKEEVVKTLIEWKNKRFANFYPIKEDLFYNRGNVDNCKKIYDFISNIPKKNFNNYKINIYNGENLKEVRMYDRNYNFITREYYTNKLRTSKLIYKDSFIHKQIVYSDTQKPIKEVTFYKNIRIKSKFIDVYDNEGNIQIKHNITSKGILSSKIIYHKGSNKVKSISKYNIKTEKISSIKQFYKNEVLHTKMIFDENGNRNKYYYYDDDGILIREYNYYNSGKIKEKIFYSKESREVIKKQLISELNQRVVSQEIFNDKTKLFNKKVYLEV